MPMAVFRILEGRARPGKVEEVARLFVSQAEVVGRAEGIAFVQVLRSDEAILAVSCWTDADAMSRYLSLPATRDFYATIPPLLMGSPSVRTYEVVSSVRGDAEAGLPDWTRA
jgi:quinol monooxygenase YgiN